MAETKNTGSDELELSDELIGKRAYFTRLEDATREDWRLILSNYRPWARALSNRVLAHLRLLEGEHGGNPVDRLQHCLQTATLALRDGRDEEYVVCALIHDIGDTLASFNHAEFAATILKPFVSEKNYWIVLNHGVYTGYYWFQYLGTDRNKRDDLRSHPWWGDLEDFCLKYDCAAFNPHYESMTLEEFEPMLHRVFAKPRASLYTKADG
ncbi:MAG TPA: HD domain-containing protein [Steroidobacteraceae bacterium]|jgi:predicted HD phosphohydrolase|nr:HD domain-containing protein [Steroidobacteraceae bacterium]